MPRERDTGMSRAESAAVARERRERARRERERLRAELHEARGAEPVREQVLLVDDAPEAAVAVRERRGGGGGLIGGVVGGVRRIPEAIVGVLRGFALEVLAVLGAMVRPLVRLVPGGSRWIDAARSTGSAVQERTRAARSGRATAERDEFDAFGTPVDDARSARRAPRTEADVRAAARRRELVQRRVRVALVAGLAVSVLAAWIYVPASDAFRIRHLEVTGASAVDDLEVRSRVDRLLAGKTVFTVDEDAVARAIEELPFVREATVSRHLPTGLELHVSEYQPLALGYGRGGTWLVARDGRLLTKARRSDWEGRVPIVTLRGRHLKPGMHLRDEPSLALLDAIPAGSTLQLKQVEAEKFELTAITEDGTEVRFGRTDQLRQKVLVAEKVLREMRRQDVELVYLDVSVPSRPAPCPDRNAGCHQKRGPVDAATNAASTAEADATVAPEERGGDELAVATAATA